MNECYWTRPRRVLRPARDVKQVIHPALVSAPPAAAAAAAAATDVAVAVARHLSRELERFFALRAHRGGAGAGVQGEDARVAGARGAARLAHAAEGVRAATGQDEPRAQRRQMQRDLLAQALTRAGDPHGLTRVR